MLAVVVATAATAITFLSVVPQIVRLLRTGDTEGVSGSWAAVGMALNVGWMAFVIAQELWIAIPSIVVAIVSFGLALFLIHRNGGAVRVGVLGAVGVMIACAIMQVTLGWIVLGTVLGLSNAAYLGPPVATVWRTHAPSGVSPVTWLLAELEGLLWGFFGVLEESGPVIVFGVTEAILSALVLLRLWVTRDRIRAEAGSGA